jgi:hypothetical protein
VTSAGGWVVSTTCVVFSANVAAPAASKNVFAARTGRIQRGIRRAFIAANGRPLCIRELLARCYPATDDHPHWHRWSIHRALPKYAIPIGRSKARGCPIMWAPNSELMQLITRSDLRIV